MLVAKIEVGYILADLQHLGKLRQRYFRIFDAKILQIFQFHNVAAELIAWHPVDVIGTEFGDGIRVDVSCEVGIPRAWCEKVAAGTNNYAMFPPDEKNKLYNTALCILQQLLLPLLTMQSSKTWESSRQSQGQTVCFSVKIFREIHKELR